MFIAQVLVGPSEPIIKIENDMVKNPNWQEASLPRSRSVSRHATLPVGGEERCVTRHRTAASRGD